MTWRIDSPAAGCGRLRSRISRRTLLGPSASRPHHKRARLTTTHDILKVVVEGHQGVLRRELRRMPQLFGDHVRRVLVYPIGLIRASFEGVHNGTRLAQANVESSSLYVRCDGNWLNFTFRKWPSPLGSVAQHHTSTEERP